jgi:pilus assembly protein FimV
VSLENFSGVSEDSDTIDVDSDKGMGAKLDLAHAYIEMGEVESARELLDEIVGKGEKEQQEEAMQVLKSLD